MGLQFYDSSKALFSTEMRTFHDGRLGGPYEQVFYLRNDNSATYYTSINITYQVTGYEDLGEYGSTGWSVKYLYGERRPTEAEWDAVASGQSITIPDIGTTAAADTSTYSPVWVRVFCPGGTAAHIRDGQVITVTFLERAVGS